MCCYLGGWDRVRRRRLHWGRRADDKRRGHCARRPGCLKLRRRAASSDSRNYTATVLIGAEVLRYAAVQGGWPNPSLKRRGWIAASAAMTGWQGSGEGAHKGRPYGLAYTYPSQLAQRGDGRNMLRPYGLVPTLATLVRGRMGNCAGQVPYRARPPAHVRSPGRQSRLPTGTRPGE